MSDRFLFERELSEDFTGDEKSTDSYRFCRAALTAGGAAAGLMVGSAGAAASLGLGALGLPILGAAGAALGNAVGARVCEGAPAWLQRKFASGQSVSDPELRLLVGSLRKAQPALSRQAALDVLAAQRRAARRA